MISVNVSFMGSDIEKLIVSGHANYDLYGKDIVCAGVSAIITGGINAIECEYKNVEIINKKNELGIHVISNNERIQIILTTLLIQLQTVEKSYEKYIKIKENKRGGV